MPTRIALLKAETKVPKAQFGMSFGLNPNMLKTFRSFQNPAPQGAAISGLKIPTVGTLPSTTQLMPKPAAVGGGGGGAGAGLGTAISGAADLAEGAVDAFSKPGVTNTWGITKENNKANTAKSTLQGVGKGASMGASLGSVIPGIGTAIGAAAGAVIGGVVGLFKGKKKAKADNKTYEDNTQAAYEGYNQKANAQQYAALAKHGIKLAVASELSASKRNAISYKTRKFKSGGKLNKLGEVNIIPSGTLHKENNNLGEHDKGIPIVDDAGTKKFEVEREELILRLKATKAVEDSINKYKATHNDKHLVDLGKFLTKEITTNTHDFSGRYGLEVK